jgi:GT2 family glycosyltransferase
MIGVVIPCHHPGPALAAAMASVGDTLTVVVDDSPQGSPPPPGVEHVRTSGSQGFSVAANAGLARLEALGCTRALVLNDDAALRPGALSAMADAFCEFDGAVAPVLHEPDGPVYGIHVHRSGRVKLARRPVAVQALSGAAILLRSQERFDPNFSHGFEDIELCERLLRRGLRVRVIADAHCDHAGGATIDRRSRQAQRAAMSGHLRWVGGGLRAGFVVGLGLAQVLREGGPAERFLGIVDGVRDHLRGPPRVP